MEDLGTDKTFQSHARYDVRPTIEQLIDKLTTHFRPNASNT